MREQSTQRLFVPPLCLLSWRNKKVGRLRRNLLCAEHICSINWNLHSKARPPFSARAQFFTIPFYHTCYEKSSRFFPTLKIPQTRFPYSPNDFPIPPQRPSIFSQIPIYQPGCPGGQCVPGASVIVTTGAARYRFCLAKPSVSMLLNRPYSLRAPHNLKLRKVKPH